MEVGGFLFEGDVADVTDAGQSARAVEFVRWANQVLERAEQRMSVAGLEALFEAEHAFGDDDDRGFYPSSDGW
jgi:hypothetical protein